jgi:hypothetical protein
VHKEYLVTINNTGTTKIVVLICIQAPTEQQMMMMMMMMIFITQHDFDCGRLCCSNGFSVCGTTAMNFGNNGNFMIHATYVYVE